MVFKSKYSDISVPEGLSLTNAVLKEMSKYGDKVALVDGTSGFSLTYEQLTKLIFAISKNLREKFNFNKGDVLGLFLPNHPMYAAYLHGTAATGAACTTINPLYTVEELTKQLVDSGASLMITIPLFLEKAIAAVEGTKVKTIFVLSKDPVEPPKDAKVPVVDAKALLAPPKDTEPVKADINPKEDVIIIPYSSGTTGLSKGVVLTHYNLLANLKQTDANEVVNSSDVMIGLLPFFHIYGIIVILNKALLSGATIVTMPKFDLEAFMKIMQDYKVTIAPIVPPIVLALAKHPIVDKFNLSSLREILCGAAPLSADLQVAASKRLGVVVKQGYGMTELSPVVTIQDDDTAIQYAGSAGVLVPSTELKVIDPSTGEEKKVNEEGELCFRGPQVMKGYLNNEKATADTIKDGWLHTGDVGYIDENGNIFVVDRVKELIKYKGFQVPPAELEGILLKHEAIADAAVVGVPDEEAGEIPKAYVVLKPGQTLTADDVIAFVAGKVSPQKKVRIVEFTDQIPKSASGKILRRVLRDKEREAQKKN